METLNQSGWTCYKCNTYVPYGHTHNCYSNQQSGYVGWPVYIDNTLLERIAVSLEKIAGILERWENIGRPMRRSDE